MEIVKKVKLKMASLVKSNASNNNNLKEFKTIKYVVTKCYWTPGFIKCARPFKD